MGFHMHLSSLPALLTVLMSIANGVCLTLPASVLVTDIHYHKTYMYRVKKAECINQLTHDG